MELKQAIALLANDHFKFPDKKVWTDLGCGNGTFTLALASLLPKDSMILAVDLDLPALNKIPHKYNSVTIEKYPADFVNQEMRFKSVDGVLMANSLHYIDDKISFIQKISGCLNDNGCFLIVEYDTNTANQWVPYPLNFSSLKKLFHSAGFSSVKKIGETPSLFRKAKLYSAIITK